MDCINTITVKIDKGDRGIWDEFFIIQFYP